MTSTPKSKAYDYVKNQVLLGNFDADDLAVLVTRNVITEAERLELLPLIK